MSNEHTSIVYLEDNYIEIIKKILSQYLDSKAKVYLFGSRASGHATEFSDIDLAINNSDNQIDLATLANLNNAFTASPLPYTVDLVDLKDVSAKFMEQINKNKIQIL
jgi:predicted nucleotidyltransferase